MRIFAVNDTEVDSILTNRDGYPGVTSKWSTPNSLNVFGGGGESEARFIGKLDRTLVDRQQRAGQCIL